MRKSAGIEGIGLWLREVAWSMLSKRLCVATFMLPEHIVSGSGPDLSVFESPEHF